MAALRLPHPALESVPSWRSAVPGRRHAQARKEGVRDGAPSIELVDGEKLIDMLEDLGLGLIPRTTYDVDEDFFAGFEGPFSRGPCLSHHAKWFSYFDGSGAGSHSTL